VKALDMMRSTIGSDLFRAAVELVRSIDTTKSIPIPTSDLRKYLHCKTLIAYMRDMYGSIPGLEEIRSLLFRHKVYDVDHQRIE
jgi:hypothetical protein